jgi:hypothetical protein
MLEGYYSCKYLVGFVERSIHCYIRVHEYRAFRVLC